jgi:hypothetical protein
MKTIAAIAFALATLMLSAATSTPVRAEDAPGIVPGASKADTAAGQTRKPKLVIITIEASSKEEAEHYAWELGNFFINTRYNAMDMHNGYWVVIGTTLVPGFIVDNHADKRAVRFEFAD